MRCLLVVLFLGICHNILARGLQDNPEISDLESRLSRLESRQFSEGQGLEHRMLQMEVQLGTQQGGENYVPIQLEPNTYRLDGKIATQKPFSDDLMLVDRLEKLEKKWEKDLEENLTKFSSKYDNLAERFAVIEKQVQNRPELEEKLLKSDEYALVLASLDKFQRIGANSYLIVHNETLNWIEALNKCDVMGADLVSLKNEQEWSAIKDHLEKDKSYWTDINDRLVETEYMSESNGNPAPFLKWDAREPNGLAYYNNEDCVELRSDYDHYMNDLHCSEQNYYICQIRKQKQ